MYHDRNLPLAHAEQRPAAIFAEFSETGVARNTKLVEWLNTFYDYHGIDRLFSSVEDSETVMLPNGQGPL